jgi:hypothetical protein
MQRPAGRRRAVWATAARAVLADYYREELDLLREMDALGGAWYPFSPSRVAARWPRERISLCENVLRALEPEPEVQPEPDFLA